MQNIAHETHCFADFTLDLTRGCLQRGNDEIKLRPKSFEVLKYLVENNGRLIRKNELIQAVWQDTAVTDDSLVQCLKDIRHALSDEAQQIIKTVHGRGYIFDKQVDDNAALVTTYREETAGVHVIIEEGEGNGHGEAETWRRDEAILPQAWQSTVPYFTATKKRLWAAGLGILTVAAIAAAAIYFTGSSKAIDSVAVMPFVNVSGDPNTEYLSDGLSDSIINNLSHLPSLKKVISFNSVLRYKGKQTDPQAVGRELGVRAVLMGRLNQQGDQLSITTELIDVTDNRRLWGEQYERKMSDLLMLQRDLSKQIANGLRLRLTGEDLKHLAVTNTENSEAYQLYLKGGYFLRKRTRDGEEKALAYFQEAIDRDQSYAPAYGGLATCYIQMGNYSRIQPEEAQSKATEAVTTALRLDDTLAGAHASLASLKFIYEWDWSGAQQEYRRAIELNPNLAELRQGYANYLMAIGRTQEAVTESKQALLLDPLSVNANSDHGMTLYLARQYDQAVEQLRQTIDMDPNFLWAHRNLGLVYAQKKMYDEAIAEFQKVQELSHGEAGEWALGHVYALAGKRDEALKIIDKSKKRSHHGYGSAMKLAVIYTGLGEKDQAFEWLEKGFAQHDPLLRSLKVDPWFDNLRSDPRFTDLLRRMKLAT
jgi:TolB-like protein/DNA-binding winged helix-turn-helix (wHTH) protein/Flp pilus assembly protein TadD